MESTSNKSFLLNYLLLDYLLLDYLLLNTTYYLTLLSTQRYSLLYMNDSSQMPTAGITRWSFYETGETATKA